MLNAENDFPATPDLAITPINGESTVTDGESTIELPPVPAEFASDKVAAWAEPLIIDTYLPVEPDDYPAFLENRVYQGSSGKVYPLPFHERIEQEKRPYAWDAIHLENEWVRLVILPQLGGRIHIGYDKVADYDFFYRNNVIKPALVGLAGPWISGGVEFNWPQHHRPGTFLPTDWEIEREADGAITVWCSDHDPMNRMKGMHGIRLRPDSSVIEARVRLYNRTDETQTFLWWANVAAAVNDDYQSFFPTDVEFVADHAKRAVATFPAVDDHYYGVDYPAQVTADRPDGDRLDWYRNIPVPTSYMVVATQDDFFGGYDHGLEAGFVYWADHTVAPGKKQWTWGNAEFGWAWDRNLTDGDGPYVELMAGAFTDNQPDFSFIAPGETKTFSQFWYPITRIGAAHQASRDAAVRLDVTAAADAGTTVAIGVAATRVVADATIELTDAGGRTVFTATADLAPGQAYRHELRLDGGYRASELTLSVRDGDTVLVTWTPREPAEDTVTPAPATEPADPASIASIDELFYTGQYLDQYRHATRVPEPYWEEALRRDPGDVRCNMALAARRERAGRHTDAEAHLRTAIDRLLARVPNPADGEAHYRLGITLVHQGRDAEAKDYLAKATWNDAWRVPAGHALARLHARAGDHATSRDALLELLRHNPEHLQANALLALTLRGSGAIADADRVLAQQLARDPLDQWTRHLAGLELSTDAPTLLDVALEYAETGHTDTALELLTAAATASTDTALGQVQVAPLAHYHRARLLDAAGRTDDAASARQDARAADARHCLPSRLADVAALEAALRADGTDARAAVLLGSWYYDKKRYTDAITVWQSAAAHAPDAQAAALVHRNLGIAAYNVQRDPAAALEHFQSAVGHAPQDAKLLYEYDQLLARTGATPAERLDRLEAHRQLAGRRDDLTVVHAGLLTAVGRSNEARNLMLGRVFQPWEGGEGQVLLAWQNACTALAELALDAGDPTAALEHVHAAITPPESLGEARHPLANSADLHWLFGEALLAAGDDEGARAAWTRAAHATGDFIDMTTRRFSDQTLFSIRALRRLGDHLAAATLILEFDDYLTELAATPARVDYFATSLPAMLLFHDDPQSVHDTYVHTLRTRLDELTAGSTAQAASATTTPHRQ
ncbi:tetratricopeptide (TPR) repeat protein [Cryobacterium sp. MP_3.1]|uniref:tetratricopeptide repeat protein n=1 Tax=Cryobacterium sp. MP_3.1 TaxID=3071711 RepID=UPI002E02DF9B|nr:tetratricopeptide (TPR) repeat protein [Cryobacterium sp. MP_3.1]